jgi:hypothetical protein
MEEIEPSMYQLPARKGELTGCTTGESDSRLGCRFRIAVTFRNAFRILVRVVSPKGILGLSKASAVLVEH